jgi:hypothetical protein
MLPIPFINYIPIFFERDDKLIAFADKIDEFLIGIKDDTIGLNDLLNPFKAPVQVLDYFGDYFNAGINIFDSEHTKRIKIATAIQSHKKRGSFVFDAKPKIDAIAGGDSQILKTFGADDWILTGDGLTPSAYYWAAMGTDGIDDDLGILLVGSGDEIIVAGNIFIDVDNNSLTAEEQLRIRIELEDIAPAYMIVHVGYLDGSGTFVEYFQMG